MTVLPSADVTTRLQFSDVTSKQISQHKNNPQLMMKYYRVAITYRCRFCKLVRCEDVCERPSIPKVKGTN